MICLRRSRASSRCVILTCSIRLLKLTSCRVSFRPRCLPSPSSFCPSSCEVCRFLPLLPAYPCADDTRSSGCLRWSADAHDRRKTLFKTFFIAQMWLGFLVITVSSGLTAALPRIAEQPGMVVSLLAEKLPLASIFFITLVRSTGTWGRVSSEFGGPTVDRPDKQVSLDRPRHCYKLSRSSSTSSSAPLSARHLARFSSKRIFYPARNGGRYVLPPGGISRLIHARLFPSMTFLACIVCRAISSELTSRRPFRMPSSRPSSVCLPWPPSSCSRWLRSTSCCASLLTL